MIILTVVIIQQILKKIQFRADYYTNLLNSVNLPPFIINNY